MENEYRQLNSLEFSNPIRIVSDFYLSGAINPLGAAVKTINQKKLFS
jgi:hypothetical protein